MKRLHTLAYFYFSFSAQYRVKRNRLKTFLSILFHPQLIEVVAAVAQVAHTAVGMQLV